MRREVRAYFWPTAEIRIRMKAAIALKVILLNQVHCRRFARMNPTKSPTVYDAPSEGAALRVGVADRGFHAMIRSATPS
jgi:hypothetical protein